MEGENSRIDQLRKRCFAIGREVFGDFKIEGKKAYDYYIKKFAKERFGKESRKDLTEEEWEEILLWLEEVKARMFLAQTTEAKIWGGSK